MERASWLSVCVLAAGMTSYAGAGEALIWPFDIATSGEDVAWTSPTGVDPDATRYRIGYQLDLVEIDVTWLVFSFTLDVTEQIPPEARTAEAVLPGPAPLELLSLPIAFPLPPDPPALAATFSVGIDKAGFGQLVLEDIALGEIEVDLGPPFGVQTVQLDGFRFAGTVTALELIGGDVTGDGLVDFSDLVQVLADWGPCPPPCPADLDGDGQVGFVDLLEVLAEWSDV
ncbi:MAG: hypothetical protein HKO59_01865 [Phycisphaerales bacterium]|nr:hypothetical protein [Phycisphaerae bacterium]NNF42441.1 hypothetical protein [Phycisphaerales bacterium]NNM24728.1 hypothetical protein [Phycisphaerales bacterium]